MNMAAIDELMGAFQRLDDLTQGIKDVEQLHAEAKSELRVYREIVRASDTTELDAADRQQREADAKRMDEQAVEIWNVRARLLKHRAATFREIKPLAEEAAAFGELHGIDTTALLQFSRTGAEVEYEAAKIVARRIAARARAVEPERKMPSWWHWTNHEAIGAVIAAAILAVAGLVIGVVKYFGSASDNENVTRPAAISPATTQATTLPASRLDAIQGYASATSVRASAFMLNRAIKAEDYDVAAQVAQEIRADIRAIEGESKSVWELKEGVRIELLTIEQTCRRLAARDDGSKRAAVQRREDIAKLHIDLVLLNESIGDWELETEVK